MNIKRFFLIILLLPILVFSNEAERRMSIQASFIPYIWQFWYLLPLLDDNDDQFDDDYVFSPDIEFQYAINKHFAFSITGSFDFRRHTASFSTTIDSEGNVTDYMNYEKSFLYTFKPAIMYHPFGTWLKGMYMSIYPVIGQQFVQSDYYDNTYTHLGIGVLSGYQWIFKKGFTMQLGTGISKSKIISSDSNKGEYHKHKDYWFKLNNFRFVYKIGYSF